MAFSQEPHGKNFCLKVLIPAFIINFVTQEGRLSVWELFFNSYIVLLKIKVEYTSLHKCVIDQSYIWGHNMYLQKNLFNANASNMPYKKNNAWYVGWMISRV